MPIDYLRFIRITRSFIEGKPDVWLNDQENDLLETLRREIKALIPEMVTYGSHRNPNSNYSREDLLKDEARLGRKLREITSQAVNTRDTLVNARSGEKNMPEDRRMALQTTLTQFSAFLKNLEDLTPPEPVAADNANPSVPQTVNAAPKNDVIKTEKTVRNAGPQQKEEEEDEKGKEFEIVRNRAPRTERRGNRPDGSIVEETLISNQPQGNQINAQPPRPWANYPVIPGKTVSHLDPELFRALIGHAESLKAGSDMNVVFFLSEYDKGENAPINVHERQLQLLKDAFSAYGAALNGGTLVGEERRRAEQYLADQITRCRDAARSGAQSVERRMRSLAPMDPEFVRFGSALGYYTACAQALDQITALDNVYTASIDTSSKLSGDTPHMIEALDDDAFQAHENRIQALKDQHRKVPDSFRRLSDSYIELRQYKQECRTMPFGAAYDALEARESELRQQLWSGTSPADADRFRRLVPELETGSILNLYDKKDEILKRRFPKDNAQLRGLIGSEKLRLEDARRMLQQHVGNIDTMIALKVVEAKKAALAQTNPRAFSNRTAFRNLEQRNAHTREVREKLAVYAKQLGEYGKVGANSTEFRNFRNALEAAAKGGSLSVLHREAEKYVTLKSAQNRNTGPSSDSGRNRLGMAKLVVSLTKFNQDIQLDPAPMEADAVDSVRGSLTNYITELDRVEKTGPNTVEYDDFRDALLSAAKPDSAREDFIKLYEMAENYRNLKTNYDFKDLARARRTAAGNLRLRTAVNVINLTRDLAGKATLTTRPFTEAGSLRKQQDLPDRQQELQGMEAEQVPVFANRHTLALTELHKDFDDNIGSYGDSTMTKSAYGELLDRFDKVKARIEELGSKSVREDYSDEERKKDEEAFAELTAANLTELRERIQVFTTEALRVPRLAFLHDILSRYEKAFSEICENPKAALQPDNAPQQAVNPDEQNAAESKDNEPPQNDRAEPHAVREPDNEAPQNDRAEPHDVEEPDNEAIDEDEPEEINNHEIPEDGIPGFFLESAQSAKEQLEEEVFNTQAKTVALSGKARQLCVDAMLPAILRCRMSEGRDALSEMDDYQIQLEDVFFPEGKVHETRELKDLIYGEYDNIIYRFELNKLQNEAVANLKEENNARKAVTDICTAQGMLRKAPPKDLINTASVRNAFRAERKALKGDQKFTAIRDRISNNPRYINELKALRSPEMTAKRLLGIFNEVKAGLTQPSARAGRVGVPSRNMDGLNRGNH